MLHYAVERLGFTELKSLQLKVALAIVTGRDVFGVLPTSYRKNLYVMPAFLYSSIACVRLKKRNS